MQLFLNSLFMHQFRGTKPERPLRRPFRLTQISQMPFVLLLSNLGTKERLICKTKFKKSLFSFHFPIRFVSCIASTVTGFANLATESACAKSAFPFTAEKPGNDLPCPGCGIAKQPRSQADLLVDLDICQPTAFWVTTMHNKTSD